MKIQKIARSKKTKIKHIQKQKQSIMGGIENSNKKYQQI